MVSNYSLPPLPEFLKVYLDTKTQKKILGTIEPIYENVVSLRAQTNRNCSNDNLETRESKACLSKTFQWFTHLKHEMTNLRELDKSLVQQLHALSDSMCQYRLLLSERHLDDTNSEYSYASIDRDMDSISSIDEFDYFTDDILHESPVTTPIGHHDTDIFFQINKLHENINTDLEI